MADVELSFFETNAERADAFSARFDCAGKSSLEELISWADAVDICLPTQLHHPVALQAIASGRAVFVEKPVTRSLAEGRELIEAVQKSGVPAMVGQVVRYFPEFRVGSELVRNGGIGNPAIARTRRGGTMPKGSDGWFADYSQSGGCLLDLAIHDFDWLRWTFGEVKHLVSKSVGISRGSGPDYALTTLTFQSGPIAHVETTWMDPGGFRTTFEVAGSEGLIEFDSRATPSLRTVTPDGTRLESNLNPTDDPYYRQLRDFVDSVQKNVSPPISIQDGFMALSISLAACESARTGERVCPEHV
jgi:predicted dehydrogenase